MKVINSTIDISGCVVIPLEDYEAMKAEIKLNESLNIQTIKMMIKKLMVSGSGAGSMKYNDHTLMRVDDGDRIYKYYIEVTDL